MKYIILLTLLLTACSPVKEIVYTHNLTREIYNNECECQPADCNCIYPEAKECIPSIQKPCNNSNFLKCTMEKARLYWEVDYYKNVTANYMLNDTDYINMQNNYTACMNRLKEINDSLN